MHLITSKIESAIYGYNPNEFFPIYCDGQPANRKAFMLYKAKKILRRG